MIEFITGSKLSLVIFLLAGAIFFFALKSIEQSLSEEAEESVSSFDDLFWIVVRTLKSWIYFVILLLIATFFFDVPENISKGREAALLILSTYQIILIITHIGEFFIKRSKATGDHEKRLFFVFSKLISIIIWVVGFLFILSNFGVNITALLAGFGIGGLAVAFAFQNILRDIFSYMTILLDQPIKEGDIIEVNGREGTVSHIGIKTTRLKASGGEEIVIANDTIATMELKNYGKAKKRRVAISLFLEHKTSQAALKKLPQDMEQLVASIDGLDHKATYIKSIGAAGIELTTIYYVKNRNFSLHRESRTALHTKIHAYLNKTKVSLVRADIVANQ